MPQVVACHNAAQCRLQVILVPESSAYTLVADAIKLHRVDCLHTL